MFVSFVVVNSHPLSKELAGGRVRAREGETEEQAVFRRVAQDTRCRVVAVHRVTPEQGTPHYDLTLHGCLAHHGPQRSVRSEGTIRVKVLSGERARGPLGSDTVAYRSPKRDASI